MTNVELLKEKIAQSGLKISFISESCGLSKQGFYNKMNGKTEFKQSEIATMKKILNLTNEDAEELFFI